MGFLLELKPAVQREAGFDGGEPPRQFLPARTTIGVLLGIVDEILLAEPAVRLGARGQRLWHDGRHARRPGKSPTGPTSSCSAALCSGDVDEETDLGHSSGRLDGKALALTRNGSGRSQRNGSCWHSPRERRALIALQREDGQRRDFVFVPPYRHCRRSSVIQDTTNSPAQNWNNNRVIINGKP
jgi:hypothetical protein